MSNLNQGSINIKEEKEKKIYQKIAETQKNGGRCALISKGYSFNQIKAKEAGVNIESLVVFEANSGREELDISNIIISSGKFDLVVVDVQEFNIFEDKKENIKNMPQSLINRG